MTRDVEKKPSHSHVTRDVARIQQHDLRHQGNLTVAFLLLSL
jgi:hypothetical protein